MQSSSSRTQPSVLRNSMFNRRSVLSTAFTAGIVAASTSVLSNSSATADSFAIPGPEGPGVDPALEQQLAAQVASLVPSYAQYIYYGPTPAAATMSPPPAARGYVPRLSGQQAVETAIRRGLTQVGHIYTWGGGSAYGPTLGVRDGGVADSYGDYRITGFDCSGLMVFSFAGAGILLPKYSGNQYRSGRHFPNSQMRRGDMIFYGPNGTQHVALSLGKGWMLESPASGERVRVTPVRTSGICPDVVRLF